MRRQLSVNADCGSYGCSLDPTHVGCSISTLNVVYVVTSGYVKKAQKLDVMEIQRAAKLMRAFLEASR